MARKLRFILPFERWSGKIAPKKHVVVDNQYKQGSPYAIGVVRTNELGTKQFYSIRTSPVSAHATAAQVASRARFKAIAARVRAVYMTPATLNSYRAQYAVAPNHDRITLRGFIWYAETELYDAEQG